MEFVAAALMTCTKPFDHGRIAAEFMELLRRGERFDEAEYVTQLVGDSIGTGGGRFAAGIFGHVDRVEASPMSSFDVAGRIVANHHSGVGGNTQLSESQVEDSLIGFFNARLFAGDE